MKERERESMSNQAKFNDQQSLLDEWIRPFKFRRVECRVSSVECNYDGPQILADKEWDPRPNMKPSNVKRAD